MLKYLLSIVLLAASAFAATTTIAQPVINPDGTSANATLVLRLNAPCKFEGKWVGANNVTVQIVNGAFKPALNLVPNDACVTGANETNTSYTAIWQHPGIPARTETWVVPTSSSPVKIEDLIVLGTLPTPLPQISLANLSRLGASVGQTICMTPTGWAPGNCGSGGSVSTIPTTTWSALESLATGTIDAHATWTQVEAVSAVTGTVTGSSTWSTIESQ